MQLSRIFLSLGQEDFVKLLRSISIGKLKTYQLYGHLKARFHMAKINSENLRKSAPRFWERLQASEDDFASDLSQAVLVSHLDMIVAVLNFLEIPHEDGFFAKDLDPAKYLTDGWEQRVFDHFRETYPAPLVLFYINHLGWEVAKTETIFAP